MPSTFTPAASTTAATAQPTSRKPQPHTRLLLPPLPTDHSPWTYNARTDTLYAAGEHLTSFKRKIVLTASRHPAHFKGEKSFVKEGEASLSTWECELAEEVVKWPVGELGDVPEQSSNGVQEKDEGDGGADSAKEEFKKPRFDSMPWTIQLTLLRILANGEPLTESEKRLVVRASRFPMQFTKYGDFKVQRGEAGRGRRRWE
jgi:hypothetical protein